MRILRTAIAVILTLVALTFAAAPALAAENSLVDTTIPSQRWLVRVWSWDHSFACSGALITPSWLLTRDGCPTNGDIDAGGQIRRATFTALRGKLLLARLDAPVTGFPSRTLATQDPAVGTDAWRYAGGDRHLDEYVRLATRIDTDAGFPTADMIVSGTPATFVRGDQGGPVFVGDTMVGITDYALRWTEDNYLDVTGPIGVLSIARNRQWLTDTMAAHPPLVIKYPQCPIFLCS
ncbi:hypothetical protein JIG36_14200 [Actinoplanes sp. LDG1-06]|uniref:Trypsin n=1 Tax=Paractinoplanes ovalisporus TaxID=2810368 RepID=A0ABS2AA48_9ACTN|nr:hypothetical protein [Actinoplanes ovalisporus]MBM2616710.1 hypothetical protein [Actinoplanes ovalisporus]